MKDTPISRRDFLRNMGIAGAGALLAASPWLSAFQKSRIHQMKNAGWRLSVPVREDVF